MSRAANADGARLCDSAGTRAQPKVKSESRKNGEFFIFLQANSLEKMISSRSRRRQPKLGRIVGPPEVSLSDFIAMATRLLALPLRATARRCVTARCASTSASTPADDSDKHVKRYPLVARGAGVQCAIKARNFMINTDIPKQMGGMDEAPQPVELLLSALVGCEQATAAYVARHMQPRFKLNRIAFAITGIRDDRGATSLPINEPAPCDARLSKITGEAVVHVRGANETQQRIDELAKLVMTRCPVADTLHAAGTKIEVKWRLAEDGE